MRKIVSAGSVYRLGERGKRIKKTPATGKQLAEIRMQNKLSEIRQYLRNASKETLIDTLLKIANKYELAELHKQTKDFVKSGGIL